MKRTEAQAQLLNKVTSLLENTPDPRLRQIMQAAVRHIHAFVAEVGLTHAEWQQGLEFLTAVGKTCTDDRQESILLSDVLGLSSAVDMANDHGPLATEGTVLGPYHVPNSPQREFSASLIDSDDGGDRLVVRGVVTSVGPGDQDGNGGTTADTPIAGAIVDVWSCATNGLYPAQDPAQATTNMRGLFKTDAEGRYEFTVVRPTNYSIPMDGPVGQMMRATARSPLRSAHVHLIISAPGHHAVTTHLFDAECPALETDSVFSTRDSLIRKFEAVVDGVYETRFDVRLMRLRKECSESREAQ